MPPTRPAQAEACRCRHRRRNRDRGSDHRQKLPHRRQGPNRQRPRWENSPETPEAMIADGIVIVQKGAVLPNGWQFADSVEA